MLGRMADIIDRGTQRSFIIDCSWRRRICESPRVLLPFYLLSWGVDIIVRKSKTPKSICSKMVILGSQVLLSMVWPHFLLRRNTINTRPVRDLGYRNKLYRSLGKISGKYLFRCGHNLEISFLAVQIGTVPKTKQHSKFAQGLSVEEGANCGNGCFHVDCLW